MVRAEEHTGVVGIPSRNLVPGEGRGSMLEAACMPAGDSQVAV